MFLITKLQNIKKQKLTELQTEIRKSTRVGNFTSQNLKDQVEENNNGKTETI